MLLLYYDRFAHGKTNDLLKISGYYWNIFGPAKKAFLSSILMFPVKHKPTKGKKIRNRSNRFVINYIFIRCKFKCNLIK